MLRLLAILLLLVVAPAAIAQPDECTQLNDPEAVADLEAARTTLVEMLVAQMPAIHRNLLLSVETGQPDWTLVDIPGAADLTAVKWRLQNIQGLDAQRRAANVAELTQLLTAAGNAAR